jgi:uncharacterized protein YbjT (DUF2867 family)
LRWPWRRGAASLRAMNSTAGKRVIVAGATGLTGRALVRALLARNDIGEVIAPVRRAGALDADALGPRETRGKLHEIVVDWDRLVADCAVPPTLVAPPWARGAQAVFCALGTTKRAAGSWARQRVVDHDYVVALGVATRAGLTPAFAFVSSIGASATGNAYLRMKAETETALNAQGWPRLVLARPSFLIGERAQMRPGEWVGVRLARLIAPLLRGPLRVYRPIRGDTLARAMIAATLDIPPIATGARPPPCVLAGRGLGV